MDVETISSFRDDIRSFSVERHINDEKKREFFVKRDNRFTKSETSDAVSTYDKSGKVISAQKSNQDTRLVTSREAIASSKSLRACGQITFNLDS